MTLYNHQPINKTNQSKSGGAMDVNTGIKIFYQARFWSNAFKNNVVCDIRTDRGKTRYTLEPDSHTLIALQPNEKYEIIAGVVQVLFNNLTFTAKSQCTLKEGEIQNFVFTPPALSFGRSVLLRE